MTVAAALCLLAALAPAAMAGSIEGTVTDSVGKEPIEGAEVCAWPLELEEPWEPEEPEEPEEPGEPEGPEPEPGWGGCVETGAGGSYALAEVPTGEYEVEFRAEGFLIQFYEGKENRWEADPVFVDEEGATTGIDAEMDTPGGIEGTVTRSSDGEPVEAVNVCAWKMVPLEFAGCEWTGPDGSYLLSELEPGEYEVEFWAGESGQNLAFQVYKEKTLWSEADPVIVEAGAVTTEIDAALDPGATISGTVSAPNGALLQGIPVCSISMPEDLLWTCGETDAGGGYSLPYLAKGQYKVAFSIDLNEWYGEEIFEEMDDGYLTEFWNNQTTLAAADVITLSTGQSQPGISATLAVPPVFPPGGTPTSPPPTVTPPTVTPPAVTPRKRKCRRGFRKKKVRGKVRCVKVRKHRKNRRRAAGSALRPLPAATTRPAFRFSR